MKIVGAYCIGARDIIVVDAARETKGVGEENRKHMPHTKRRKCELGEEGGKHAAFLRTRRTIVRF